MNSGARFTEIDISAYLDGEMSTADRPEFEAWLAENPEMQRLLADYRTDQAGLGAAFDAMLAEPVPDRLSAIVDGAPAARMPAPLWQVAAAAIIFVAGLAAGWVLAERPAAAPPLAHTPDRALDAHLVFASEVRHPVED